MNMHVPTFHDSRCHHRGMSARRSPSPEKNVNAALEAVISAWCGSSNRRFYDKRIERGGRKRQTIGRQGGGAS
jgi:hypothetical protein